MRAELRRRAVAAAVVVLPAIGLSAAQGPAGAVGADHHGAIVAESPRGNTPHIMDGTVLAITQVGNRIVVGGTFTSVSPSGSFTDTSDDLARRGLFAFNATTGRIDTTFDPGVDGEVRSLDTDGTHVFASGAFASVNGDPGIKRLVKLDMTGTPVPAFEAVPNAVANEVVVRGSRVYIGGGFTSVRSRGVTYQLDRLAVLDAVAGTPDPAAMDFDFSGVYDPANGDPGSTNVKRFDVTSNGTKLVAVGNFTTISGQTRNQLAVFDVGGPTASLTSFATNRFDRAHSVCTYVVDTPMRDVDFSPDGTFFVVTTTGAYGGGAWASSLCDTSTRWESNETTNDPTWIAYTGGDTTFGVAVTDAVVYLGGHMRWQNNPFQDNQAGPGAVAREGIAALDAVNGIPLSWNPGRERGEGAQALFATSEGLWVGSDTTWFNGQRRGRIAFVPTTGGGKMPCVAQARLPNSLYGFPANQGAGGYVKRAVDATGAPIAPATTVDSATDWSQLRGAFEINGALYYGMSDNAVYKRSFDEQTGELGAPWPLDLHDDPDDGGRIPWPIAAMTGMFYDPDTHHIYYTVAGDARLFAVGFSPESEIVGALPVAADAGSVSFANAAGLTLADGRIFYGSTDGTLRSVPFAGGRVTGAPSVVSTDGSWTFRGLFVPNGGAGPCVDPVAHGDVLHTTPGTAVNLAAPGVLVNDWDPQAGSELVVADVSPPGHGVATVSGDGELHYAPDAGFTGWDSFTYRAVDAQGHLSAPATVWIFVGTPAAPPVGPAPGVTPRIVIAEGRGLKAGADGRSGTFPVSFSAAPGVTVTATSSNHKLVRPRAIKIKPVADGSALVTITTNRKAQGRRAVVTLVAANGALRSTVTITVIVGTGRADRLKGTSGADLLVGLAGVDRLTGRAGRDVLAGGGGADRLVSGPGADAVRN
jgi:hypothetical protein